MIVALFLSHFYPPILFICLISSSSFEDFVLLLPSLPPSLLTMACKSARMVAFLSSSDLLSTASSSFTLMLRT